MQSLAEETSDLSRNEDVQVIEDQILVAVNTGTSQVPGVGSQTTQSIILLWLTGNCSVMLAEKLSLRREVVYA